MSFTKKVAGGLIVGIVSLAVIGAASPTPSASEVKSKVPAVLSESTTKPTVETQTITETEPVVFKSVEQNDASLTQGTRKVITVGINGVRTITYHVTLTDKKETQRQKTSEAITKQPVDQVTAIGTKVAVTPTPAPQPSPAPAVKPASNCDPNYSGCVPIASDVDCADGSGNGPAYVRGPVRIHGTDIYGLDGKDRDGIGCE